MAATPNPTHVAGYDLEDSTEHNSSQSPTSVPLPTSPPPQEPSSAATPLNPFGPDDSSHPTGVQQAQGTPDLPERPPQDTQHTQEDEFANPRIAALHAMFPDFDAEFLHNVLDSVGGNQERAVEALLGMSDPDYVATQAPEPEPQQTTPREGQRSQTDLDEDFARQLMLQDEEEYRRESREQGRRSYDIRTGDQWNWFPQAGQQQQQQQGSRQTGAYNSNSWGGGSPGAGGQQKDTMADVQDQFNKIAESGKRTFSSIVSKVKAKVQEFDQSRAQNAQGSSTGTQPSWGGVSGSGGPGPDRHSQQAYYAPTSNSPPPQQNAPYENRRPRGSYDAMRQPTNSPPPPASGAYVPPLTDSSVPPPPMTNSGHPSANTSIDTGRIGLLPKRPVSLAGASPQVSSTGGYNANTNTANTVAHNTVTRDDDSEELEYMENPFEERR